MPARPTIYFNGEPCSPEDAATEMSKAGVPAWAIAAYLDTAEPVPAGESASACLSVRRGRRIRPRWKPRYVVLPVGQG